MTRRSDAALRPLTDADSLAYLQLRCASCPTTMNALISVAAWQAYLADETLSVTEAFPDLTATDHMFILTGWCPACADAAMPVEVDPAC